MPKAKSRPRKRLVLKRHFEGWQAGLVAVGLAVCAAALATPRAVEPHFAPLPTVDLGELERLRAQELSDYRDAVDKPLPYEVRAIGEAFRMHNRAAARGDVKEAALNMRRVRVASGKYLKQHGPADLARLRAAQTQLFLSALEAFEASAQEGADLEELGGDFMAKARRAGWLRDGKLVLSDLERRTWFRIRWSEVAELRGQQPFIPTLDEWRVYYRFLLKHPAQDSPTPERLKVAAAVGRLDPEYPTLLASGVIYYRAGLFLEAERAFRSHLAKHPQGPWRLRAQNYLVAALEKLHTPVP